MRSCVELLRSLGVQTSFISPAELRALEPSADVADFACAAYEPEAGYCDPRAAAAGFATAFLRAGGTAVYGARVTALRRVGSAWRVETTSGGVEAPVVVNAAG